MRLAYALLNVTRDLRRQLTPRRAASRRRRESLHAMTASERLEFRALLSSVVSVTSSVDPTATESTGPVDSATFTVSRTGDVSNTISVFFTLSGTGVNGTDYQTITQPVSIPAFQTSAVVTVTPIDDTLVEGTETVILTLNAGAGYTIGTPSNATVEILDNDTASNPTVTVSVPDAAASETGPDKGTIRFTRTGGNQSQELQVDISTGGSAIPGVDYTAIGSFVVIPANQSFVDLDITPIDDAIFEQTEDATIGIVAGTGYTVGTPSSGTVNIADNDTSSNATVTITVPDASASETGPDSGTIRVNRSGGNMSQSLTVNITVAGSATQGVDYGSIGTTVVIPANLTSKDIVITPIDDAVVESTESVLITAVTGAGYSVGTPSSGSVNITDNDTNPYLPPVFDRPPTPNPGSTVPISLCDSEVGWIDIAGHDQDSYGSTVVSFSVSGASGFSIGTNPGSGSSAIRVGESVSDGTYQLTLTATDQDAPPNQGTASFQFWVSVDRELTPGSTSVSVTAPSSSRVIEMADQATTQSVTLAWTAATDADEYDWELWVYDGGTSNGGWAQIETGSTTTLSRTISTYGEGYYAFVVRGTNHCGDGPWAGVTYAIVEHGNLDLASLDQGHNYEDTCECEPLPPGTDVAEGRVTDGWGDFLLGVRTIFGDLVESTSGLGVFLFPNFVSNGGGQLSVGAEIPFPAAPIDVDVDVDVYSQPNSGGGGGAGTFVGRMSATPGTNSELTQENGRTSIRIDPSGLVDTGGNPVPSIPSGNYYATASVSATLPQFSVSGKFAPSLLMNYNSATADLNYLNPAERNFAKKFATPELTRARVDDNGLSVYRSNGTTARFQKNGSGYDTPAGSFTTASTTGGTVIPDPRQGYADRTALYELTTLSGMTAFFDADGLMLELRDAEGNIFRFAYEDKKSDGTADDVVYIGSVHTGQSVQFNYSGGLVSTVVDWVGRTWTYLYDTASHITSITGEAPEPGKPAPKVTFTWDTGTDDLASWTVTDTDDTEFTKTEIDWDAWGNVEEVRQLDHLGTSGGTSRVWVFESAESRQLDQVQVVDDDGALDPEDAWDKVTFPDASVATREVDAFGSTTKEERTVLGYVAGTTVTMSISRNLAGQVTTLGPIEQQDSVDGTQTVPAISFGYDSEGRRTSITYADGTTDQWTFSTGASALEPDTHTNRVGHHFDYQYDAEGFPTRIDFYASLGGTLVSTTRYTYIHGRVKTIATADPNGLGSTGTGVEYYYDPHFNLLHARTTTADANGVLAAESVNDIWVSFGYDTVENLDWATTQYQPGSLTTVTMWGVQESVPTTSDVNLLAVKTEVSADLYGSVLNLITPNPGAGGSALQYSWTWDAIGRMKTSVEPGGGSGTTKYTYTSFGEVRQIEFPDPDGAGPLLVPFTEFVVDLNGNVKETRQWDGSTIVSRTFTQFDSMGRLRSQSMPVATAALLNENTWFRYDPAGRVTYAKSPVGKAGLNEDKYFVTEFDYSDATRTVTTSFSSIGAPDPGFASATNVSDPLGRPTSSSQGGLTTSWSYADGSTWLGKKGTLVTTTDSRGQQWSTKYGPTGQMIATETPDADGAGPLGKLLTTYVLDVRGNIDTMTESSGGFSRLTDFAFDYRDLLISITTPDPDGAGALVALQTTFGYDALQRPISETNVATGVVNSTTYDARGRIDTVIRIDGDAGTPDRYLTYGYDNLNRVVNQLTPDGQSQLVYDVFGNIAQTTTANPSGDLPPISVSYLYMEDNDVQTVLPGIPLQQTIDTDGSRTSYTFDSAGRLLTRYRPRHSASNDPDVDDGNPSPTATETWEYDAASAQK